MSGVDYVLDIAPLPPLFPPGGTSSRGRVGTKIICSAVQKLGTLGTLYSPTFLLLRYVFANKGKLENVSFSFFFTVTYRSRRDYVFSKVSIQENGNHLRGRNTSES